MVPNILHTAKTDGVDWWYRPLQAVVATAAFQRMAPNRLLLHTDVVPNTQYWARVKPFTSVRLAEVPKNITRHSGEEQELKYPAHRSDVLRAQLLEAHGGVWMDWDVIPHRPHDALRAALLPAPLQQSMGLRLPTGSIVPAAPGAQPSAVLAREKHVLQKGAVFYGYFGVAVMAAPRGSAFMRAWGEAQRSEYSYECYTCGSTVAVTRMLQARLDWAVELPWRTWYAPGWEADAVQWLIQPRQEVDGEDVKRVTADMHALHLFFSHGSWSQHREFDFLEEFSKAGAPSSVLHYLTQDVFQYKPSAMLVAMNTPAVLFRSVLRSAFCAAGDGAPADLRLAAKAAHQQAERASSAASAHTAADAIDQVLGRIRRAHGLAFLRGVPSAWGDAARSNAASAPVAATADSSNGDLSVDFLRSRVLGSVLSGDTANETGQRRPAVDLLDAAASNAPDIHALLEEYVSPEDVLREFAARLIASSSAEWLCGGAGSPRLTLLSARAQLVEKRLAELHDTADVTSAGHAAAAGASSAVAAVEAEVTAEVEAALLRRISDTTHALGVAVAMSQKRQL